LNYETHDGSMESNQTAFNWTVRDYILYIFHQWYLPFTFLILGSLIGWGISFVAPTQYKSSRQLVVTVDFDQDVRNLDDYKNAQIRQLEALVMSDEIIGRMLEDAGEPNSNPNTINSAREKLNVVWMDVGIWTLTVVADDSVQARKWVESWEDSIIAQINDLQKNSDMAEELKLELDETRISIQETLDRERRIQAYIVKSKTLTDELISLNEGVLDSTMIEMMNNLGREINARELISSEINFLEPESTIEQGIQWLLDGQDLLQLEKEMIGSELTILKGQRSKTTKKIMVLRRSLGGISSGLHVGRNESENTIVKPIRPTGLFILFTGILSLAVWLVYALIKIKNYGKA